LSDDEGREIAAATHRGANKHGGGENDSQLKARRDQAQATQRPAHRPKKPAADLIELANRPEESWANQEKVSPTSIGGSTKAERRLRKDRPDLHARVLAGELSWNAAAQGGSNPGAVMNEAMAVTRRLIEGLFAGTIVPVNCGV
jgi:hypothetical protein